MGHRAKLHYVCSAEDVDARSINSHFIVEVQVDGRPEEGVLEEMTRWICIASLALETLDVLVDPVRSKLSIRRLQLVAHKIGSKDCANEIESGWFRSEHDNANVE